VPDSHDDEPSPDAASVLRAFARPMQYRHSQRGANALSIGVGDGDARAIPPVRLVLPDQTVKLGLPPVRGDDMGGGFGLDDVSARAQSQLAREAAAAQQANDLSRLVIFTRLPAPELAARMKKCTVLLACLAVAELVLLLMLLLPGSPYRNVPSVPEYWARDVIRFLCSLAILAFGAGAVLRRHTTHLVLFECALYIDAALTLMRCNTLASFLHLGCQLWICYLAEIVRALNVRRSPRCVCSPCSTFQRSLLLSN
jgi:hypothetical protein